MPAESAASLKSIVDYVLAHGQNPLLMQFIANAIHWRVIVPGDRPIASYRNKQVEGDFRSMGSSDRADFDAVPPALAPDAAVRSPRLTVLSSRGWRFCKIPPETRQLAHLLSTGAVVWWRGHRRSDGGFSGNEKCFEAVFPSRQFRPVSVRSPVVFQPCGETATGLSRHRHEAAGTNATCDFGQQVGLPIHPANDQIPGTGLHLIRMGFQIGVQKSHARQRLWNKIDTSHLPAAFRQPESVAPRAACQIQSPTGHRSFEQCH
jgi:hypothetical protein